MKRFAYSSALKARFSSWVAPVLLPVLDLLLRLLSSPPRAANVPENDLLADDISDPANPLSPLNPVNASTGIPASPVTEDSNPEDPTCHRDFEAAASDFQSDSFICVDSLEPTADIAECNSGSTDAFSSNDF